jgi:uncharacterized membrane-anchored protein
MALKSRSGRPVVVEILGLIGAVLGGASIWFGRPAQPWLVLAACVVWGTAAVILAVHSLQREREREGKHLADREPTTLD